MVLLEAVTVAFLCVRFNLALASLQFKLSPVVLRVKLYTPAVKFKSGLVYHPVALVTPSLTALILEAFIIN